MQYFDHDTTAGSDDKIIALRLDQGGAAVDAYWTILEQIYRDETPLVFFGNRHAIRSLCHRLAIDENTLEAYVLSMLEIGLLQRHQENPDSLVSDRAVENISAYQEKRESARQNGKKGGRKPKQKPTENQVGFSLETNAETKGKTNKRKEKKGIDTHKGYQIPIASDGADAGETAPPPQGRPHCPKCCSKVWKNPQTGRFDCDECRAELKASEVVWA